MVFSFAVRNHDGSVGEMRMDDATNERARMVRKLIEKVKKMMNCETLDEETTRAVERMMVIRISTKHINLWMRQLEMKKKEVGELAGLLKLEEVRKEIEKEKNLEKWGGDARTLSPRR